MSFSLRLDIFFIQNLRVISMEKKNDRVIYLFNFTNYYKADIIPWEKARYILTYLKLLFLIWQFLKLT